MAPAIPRQPHLHELGQFLRTRRDALSATELGFGSVDERRRVSGLRRDEVAVLAHISIDYYTRIEQGRVAPSVPVLAALVEALQLDKDQADYLGSLLEHSARTAPAPVSPSGRGRTRVHPRLQRLLNQLADTPALVLGPRTDVLAWNALASKLYVDFAALTPRERNYTRLIFTNPTLRNLFTDWQSVARSCVAILRREAASTPDDPALSTLVGELSIADRQFAQWWSARGVARQDFGTKVINHPQVGEITLDWDIFRHDGTPEQQLILTFAEDGSVSQKRINQLLNLS